MFLQVVVACTLSAGLVWFTNRWPNGPARNPLRSRSADPVKQEAIRLIRRTLGQIQARRDSGTPGREAPFAFAHAEDHPALPSAPIVRAPISSQDEVIDELPLGIAVFGADQRLLSFNSRLAATFGFSDAWLSDGPAFGDMLDVLRTERRIPEQRDYRAWKRQTASVFLLERARREIVWHLPNGHSLRVTSCPHGLGGLAFLFEDITRELELASRYNALVNVRKATLDTFADALAVFGMDGRLKVHNQAFAKLWRLTDDELAGEPHLQQLSQLCAGQTGSDDVFGFVLADVSGGSEQRDTRRVVEWIDGRRLMLALSRLPDGTTLVRFSHIVDGGLWKATQNAA